MTSPQLFLETIFRDLGAAEAVALATTTEHEWRVVYPVRAWHSGAPVWSRATHFSVGALLKDQGGKFSRKKGYFSGAYCLVLDDIYEKATPPEIEPTWKMRTKPGSEQWGYAFSQPLRDQETFDDLIAAFIAAGHSDPGATGSVRLVRLPGSKPLGKEHAAQLIHWEPNRRMKPDPDLILEHFSLKRVHALRRSTGGGVSSVAEGTDPVLDWLHSQGMVLGTATNGWVPIRCPWVDQHSEGPSKETGTVYSPTTTQDAYRGFHCHHRCSSPEYGRDTQAFLQWVRDQGGPDAETIDFVALQARKAELAALRKDTPAYAVDPVLVAHVEDLRRAQDPAEYVRHLNNVLWCLLRDGWTPIKVVDACRTGVLTSGPLTVAEVADFVDRTAPGIILKQARMATRAQDDHLNALGKKAAEAQGLKAANLFMKIAKKVPRKLRQSALEWLRDEWADGA